MIAGMTISWKFMKPTSHPASPLGWWQVFLHARGPNRWSQFFGPSWWTSEQPADLCLRINGFNGKIHGKTMGEAMDVGNIRVIWEIKLQKSPYFASHHWQHWSSKMTPGVPEESAVQETDWHWGITLSSSASCTRFRRPLAVFLTSTMVSVGCWLGGISWRRLNMFKNKSWDGNYMKLLGDIRGICWTTCRSFFLWANGRVIGMDYGEIPIVSAFFLLILSFVNVSSERMQWVIMKEYEISNDIYIESIDLYRSLDIFMI